MICPGGRWQCPAGQKCCPHTLEPGRWGCCRLGPGAACCPDYINCCPPGSQCDIVRHRCVHSSLLVNNTDKLSRDGIAGIHPKVSTIIPSQQLETSLMKRIGFRHTSGDILLPDEKYQCPDGTSPCELIYGIYGCCPIQNKREIKIMETKGYVKVWRGHSCFLALVNCMYLFLTSLPRRPKNVCVGG